MEEIVTRASKGIEIKEIIEKQAVFFASNKTLELNFRLQQLRKLYKALEEFEDQIYKALNDDFKKSEFETYGTEIALIQKEIKYFLRHLPKLIRPEKVKSSIASFPAKSYLYREPFGLSLIIGPWNYPLHLVLLPLVGSIAAGNCIVLKPSELTQNTSGIIKKIIEANYPEEYITVLEGGRELTTELLSNKFDHIFFTGSVKVGKIIYEAAAQNLTPCVLELGGKSPCIVDKDADLDLAAKRIVWGKLLNGGQTCVAPDYLLVHQQVKKQLINKLIFYINKFYGEDPQKSPDFPRIINQSNFNRLKSLLLPEKIIFGGFTDAKENYISPTILDNISWDDPIMEEEIFGPLLPVLEFSDLDEMIRELKNRPKPLALYYFSKRKNKQEKILRELPAGGGCINDTLLQFGSTSIPVGGVGNSGIGSYHGEQSFHTFSNTKGIVKKKTKLDIPIRYAPYKGKMKLLKLIFKI